jgi:hypothetical protein
MYIYITTDGFGLMGLISVVLMSRMKVTAIYSYIYGWGWVDEILEGARYRIDRANRKVLLTSKDDSYTDETDCSGRLLVSKTFIYI